MTFLADLFHNTIFLSAVTGWLVAQVMKTVIHLILTKEFVAERMVGSGGMPSSHSATVCGLADIVPTLIELMGMEKPVEMTGKSLLIKK